MTKIDKIWIKSMEIGADIWGCHQIPERSYFVFGYQMPVCARCFGLILGEITGLIGAQFTKRFDVNVLCALCVPLILDGTTQQISKYHSTNPRRLVTGFMSGFGVMGLMITFYIKAKKYLCHAKM